MQCHSTTGAEADVNSGDAAELAGLLQAAEHQTQDLQWQLEAAQTHSAALQAKLDAALETQWAAESECLKLTAELGNLQQQLRSSRRDMTLYQSQELELQVCYTSGTWLHRCSWVHKGPS